MLTNEDQDPSAGRKKGHQIPSRSLPWHCRDQEVSLGVHVTLQGAKDSMVNPGVCTDPGRTQTQGLGDRMRKKKPETRKDVKLREHYSLELCPLESPPPTHQLFLDFATFYFPRKEEV